MMMTDTAGKPSSKLQLLAKMMVELHSSLDEITIMKGVGIDQCASSFGSLMSAAWSKIECARSILSIEILTYCIAGNIGGN